MNLAEALPFTQVDITEDFWLPRIEINRTNSIPVMFRGYVGRGRLPSLKLIEAAGYSLAKHPDQEFQRYVDIFVDKIIEELLAGDPDEKWKKLLDGELYRAGHFFEAAVAYYQATGNKKILDAAVKLADQIDAVFGPDKRREVSNHEEVKIGLLKLFRLTGEERCLDLAKFFLEERGHSHGGRKLFGEYAQDHLPVKDQREAVGHCVRATYLYIPLAEMAAITSDPSYVEASKRIWNDAVFRKTYLTGHIGSHRDHEDFGDVYELPNLSCWNETCAAIGNVIWNHRLFLLFRDAKYLDVMERALYNGFLVGISLSGDLYFYQNPLKTFGDFKRHPWFGPNCCPPNVVRLMASLGGYIYATHGDDLYVNLFIASKATVKMGQNNVCIRQETCYPWDGKIKMTISPEKQGVFSILIRIPGWALNQPMPSDLYRYLERSDEGISLKINGEPFNLEMERGFTRIERKWKAADVIELDLPMPVRRVIALEKVIDDRGMVALERGPLVYCAEGVDNKSDLSTLLIPDDSAFEAKFREDLLNGVAVITGRIVALNHGDDKISIIRKPHDLVAIPYYAWANRGTGEMAVWLARDEFRVRLSPRPTIASTSLASSSCGRGSIRDNYPGGAVPEIEKRFFPSAQSGSGDINVIFDQAVPLDSADGSSLYFRLRPQTGNLARVQYNFKSVKEVSSVEVYWKDDREYCILPASWRVLYRHVDKWKPVSNHTPYGVEKDRFNTVSFVPVKTDALRLEIQLRAILFKKGELGPPDANYLKEDVVWHECGIIEWKVY